ncbi:hypothetical protein [Candidatus Vondammii sp. HM_W22]|uniref:hypothetical protein n=1 Tax=Candidatus Vondammii sp. HM_W22 TaxID=2687299 RepID=UPI001F148917|nr:hypothetical protein [Candidatus Vondammii sp. HM_W22]
MNKTFCFLLLLTSNMAIAGEVEIKNARIQLTGTDTYRFDVTLNHGNTGWEHYADAWEVLGTRVLYHPHVNEQPFTRSLSNVHIPKETPYVEIQAHEKIHGDSKGRYRV